MSRKLIWMLGYFKAKASPVRIYKNWKYELNMWLRFWKSFDKYKKLLPNQNQALLDNLYPCIYENTSETSIEPTYFYQDCWAFEKIVTQCPLNHIDVGSHHKYVALLSKVVSVTMVDIRPLSLPLTTLTFKEGSILNLPFEDNSIESLSSLCVIEHIGLGRYGDTLDAEGTEKAIKELKRVLKYGGYLYISVPIVGSENLTFFNAHRAFTEEYLEKCFSPFEIIERRYIYDKTFGDIRQDNKFGIGLYQIRK
jgi:SAM-dependent methyltransferase